MRYELIKQVYPLTAPISILERVLTNRGIALNDIEEFINPTDKDIIDPSLIEHIDEGARMLLKHIALDHNIFIQVDPDADGFTSSAVLINYLYNLYPDFVKNRISYRLHTGKQHGLLLETIPDDAALVIAPDSSSNDYGVHQLLKERGTDILVIDHHEAEHYSQYACVINNQMCNYPNKTLSGVGMVYKFCSYIDEITGNDYADNYLDLTAVGIIADVMLLKEFETRRIITKGLNNVKNLFLKAFIQKQSYSLGNSGLTPFGVAFYIAPYINAVIRVGSQEEKELLFKALIDYEGETMVQSTKRGSMDGDMETLVEQVCRMCTNLKSRQSKSTDVVEQLFKVIEDEKLDKNKVIIVQLDDVKVDKNLTGLLANQLASKYQRPILLLNNNGGFYEGSGRTYDKGEDIELKNILNDSGLVEYAQGHQGAFGVGIRPENIAALTNYLNTELRDYDFSPKYNVDYIYNDGTNINKIDLLEVGTAKMLWGQGVEEPLIAIENVDVSFDNITLMSENRNPTLKITLPNGIGMIKFKSSRDECNKLANTRINIVGKCEANVWNGNVSPQIIIEDYEITEE